MAAGLRRILKRAVLGVVALAAALVGLFVLNGLVLAPGETPVLGELPAHPEAPPIRKGDVVTLFGFNIAKCGAHLGGRRFDTTADVRARVAEIAALIRAERPDFVFLSEALFECGPCPVNQVVEIADAAGMRFWAFGENYDVGIPFFKISGGSAILSRRRLEGFANPPLPGRRPFWVTTNNRRVLFCRAEIGGRAILVGSVHDDSYSLAGNAAQSKWILDWLAGRPAVVGGDFNAQAGDESIRLFKDAGTFSGDFDGPKSFPSDGPKVRNDQIFAPRTWTLLESRTVPSLVSDHIPVVCKFRAD